MTMHNTLHEHDTNGVLSPITTKDGFRTMATRQGIPFRESAGTIFCLDMSQLPGGLRSLFDDQGRWIEVD